MPSDIQQILIEEAEQSGEWMSDVLVGPLPKGNLDAFKKKGVSVYYLPKDERDRWAKEFEKSNKELFSEFGELGKRIMEIASRTKIPLQLGNTHGGSNDGSVFIPNGAANIPLSWPGAYSHSFIEKIHRRDLEALTDLIAVLVKEF